MHVIIFQSFNTDKNDYMYSLTNSFHSHETSTTSLVFSKLPD